MEKLRKLLNTFENEMWKAKAPLEKHVVLFWRFLINFIVWREQTRFSWKTYIALLFNELIGSDKLNNYANNRKTVREFRNKLIE